MQVTHLFNWSDLHHRFSGFELRRLYTCLAFQTPCKDRYHILRVPRLVTKYMYQEVIPRSNSFPYAFGHWCLILENHKRGTWEMAM
jgi:hypothetical protein